MTGHAKKLLSALLLLTLPFIVTACGSDDDTPTSPTTAPTILSLSPSSPSASASTYSMNVTGTNFVAGLSLILKSPNAGAVEFGGSAISSVTATSFTAAVTTPAAGSWTATVKNPDGTASAEFGFTVQGASNPSGMATVTSVTGTSALLASQDKQAVYVRGTNFTSGMTVTFTSPSGGTETVSGTNISAQTATSFTAAATLGSAGTWQIKVMNTTGVDSAPFTFSVGGGTVGTLAITGISPNPIVISDSMQSFHVTGTGFLTGLRFVLNGPDTGAVGYSGADVQNVTSTGFTGTGRVHVAGNWTIVVYNPDEAASNLYGFQAVAVIAEAMAHAFGFERPSAAVVGH